jgi:hypothetical protein
MMVGSMGQRLGGWVAGAHPAMVENEVPSNCLPARWWGWNQSGLAGTDIAAGCWALALGRARLLVS